MRLLRVSDACALTGYKRATFYTRVKEKLLPKPVSIGVQNRVWPEPELIAINKARVAGKTDDEIRELVRSLETQRADVAA